MKTYSRIDKEVCAYSASGFADAEVLAVTGVFMRRAGEKEFANITRSGFYRLEGNFIFLQPEVLADNDGGEMVIESAVTPMFESANVPSDFLSRHSGAIISGAVAELAKQNLAQVQQGHTVTVPQSAAPAAVPRSSGNSQAVANARARYNRMNELYEMGAVSAMQRDQAAADLSAAEAAQAPAPAVSAPATSYQTMTQPANPEAVKQAELAVKQAEAALENAKQDAQATEIVAPVSGTVYYGENVQEGTQFKAGATVANIGDASNIWVEARLSPSWQGKIRLGQFVNYTIEGKKYQGTVLDIIQPDHETDVDGSSDVSAGSQEKPEDGVAAPSASEAADDATKAGGSESTDSATEGSAPDISDGRMVVKISLPKEILDTVRLGTDVVVRFSSVEG